MDLFQFFSLFSMLLSNTERLRRLDQSIRSTLAEKQKIVCDIFRVPNEHFSAIADIAGQPEAPKVSRRHPFHFITLIFAILFHILCILFVLLLCIMCFV